MFADDTATIAESRQTWLANRKINGHVGQITEYFNKWKLQINPTKTQLINFAQKRNIENLKIVKVNDVEIQTCDSVRYLGVELDRKLNFDNHIKRTRQKALVATT